jgi:hypothetical protein
VRRAWHGSRAHVESTFAKGGEFLRAAPTRQPERRPPRSGADLGARREVMYGLGDRGPEPDHSTDTKLELTGSPPQA